MANQVLEWATVLLPTLFAVVLALMDEHVKTNPKRFWAVIVFGVAISVLSWVQIHRTDSAHAAELETQAKREERAVGDLKVTLQANEVRNARDMGYLKGRLEESLSRQLAPGFDATKLAAAISDQIKAETRGLSDKDLAEKALSFAQELVVLSADHRRQEDQRSEQERAEAITVGYNDQAKQVALWQKWRGIDEQDRQAWEYKYRTNYLSRAVYYRDTLWSRLGISEQQLKGFYQTNQLAFRGILAGPDPVGEAAEYLQTLAHQLLSKLGTKQPS